MITYYLLLDPNHKNMVVKSVGREQYRYDKAKGWIQTAIMVHYWFDESDTYDMYKEISEEEAIQIIKQSREPI